MKTTSYEGACRLLEDLVDTFELHRVLGALTNVCQAKAEHLQDRLARCDRRPGAGAPRHRS